MKTEIERIKEIFESNMEALRNSVPDFASMWEEAENISRKKGRFVWKIAASVTLLLIAGAAVVLYQRGPMNQTKSTEQIESWTEPTKGLMGAPPGSSLAVFTKWSSPTTFLLPKQSKYTIIL